jgi:L-rhamnose-H+ transport protein
MINRSWWGIAIILLSGVFNGSFPLPMKYSRNWKWENTWLMFCSVSLVILPWSLAIGLTPEIIRVYREVPGRALCYPLTFGFLWGIAQVTFGIGIDAVGMALTFAVVMGLACLFGSLIPLLVLTPGDLLQPRGLLLLVSMPVLFLGLFFCGLAGKGREKETAASPKDASGMSYWAGLAICIFTGVFGANLNLGFAFSGAIISTSQALGANAVTSTYPVWALVLGAGFVPNLIYCGYLLFRNHSWAFFGRPGWRKETAIGVAMGVLWLAGIDCYGVGATLVGKQGTSIGFALFLAVSILSSNILGVLTGEWKATSRATKRQLAVGAAIVLVAVVMLNLGGFF